MITYSNIIFPYSVIYTSIKFFSRVENNPDIPGVTRALNCVSFKCALLIVRIPV